MRGSMILLAAIGLGLVACGGDDDDMSSPENSDAVVAQFSSGGGIAGPCCDPWVVPELTVYGDGRVLVIGDSGGLRQAKVSPTDVAALLADAAEAGLLDQPTPDTGTLCCDLGDTVVALTDAKGTHRFSVVGLGGEENANADLTAGQRAVRQAIVDLRSGLDRLVRESNDVGDYAPEELAAYVSPADDAGPGVETPPWPLPGSLAEGCLHITTGVDKVLDAGADAPTTWSSAGRTWRVILRPLLPHEHDCP